VIINYKAKNSTTKLV